MKPALPRLAALVVAGLLAVPAVSASRVNSAVDAGFVTRSASRLMLAGHSFRFSGANIYWPVITEFGGTAPCADSQRTCRYTTPFEIDDALRMAQEMGATVIRSHAAVSIGCDLCIQPAPGRPGNAVALRHLDYFVAAAHAHGIRLILPLVDNWHYFQGGIHDYVAPHTYALKGLAPSVAEKAAFFSDPVQIGYFEAHIRLILNRVNSYTNVAYKDDPTILAWELGNEVLDAPYSWLNTIAAYIKSIDHHHLVGFDQTVGHTGGINPSSLLVPAIDIEDDHLYPPNMTIDRVAGDAALSAQHDKAYILGEYNWTLPSVGALLSSIEQNANVSGDLYWSLVSHRIDFGTWDDDRFNGTYPGSTPARQHSFAVIRTHAFVMQGQGVPAAGVPGTPSNIGIVGNQLTWRGAAPAVAYFLLRSTQGPHTGYTVVCDQCTTDYELPWTDVSQPAGSLWYRVRGISSDGTPGPFSTASNVFVDPLDGWHGAGLYFHTKGLAFDKTNAAFLGNDPSRAYRSTSKGGDYIIWRLAGIKAFQASTYYWPGAPVTPFALYTSPNGKTWKTADPSVKVTEGAWPRYTYTLSGLIKVGFIKLVWPRTTRVAWSPQVGRVALTP